MGFSTGKIFSCNFIDEWLLNEASMLVSLGLRDAGYTYFNIDDCWSLPNRDSNGHIQPDPAKFPKTIQSLATGLKAMKLKFGISSAAGVMSCSYGAGSLTYEQIDA